MASLWHAASVYQELSIFFTMSSETKVALTEESRDLITTVMPGDKKIAIYLASCLAPGATSM